MALSKNKPTQSRAGNIYERKVKAGEKIFTGALVCLEAGLAIAGKTAVGLSAYGIAQKLTDNTAGADGDLSVRIETNGVFGFVGTGVTEAHIGKMSYVIDDETVGFDDGGGTRSEAGKIMDVSKGLVWVQL